MAFKALVLLPAAVAATPAKGPYKTSAYQTIAKIPGLTTTPDSAGIVYPTSGAAGERFPLLVHGHGAGSTSTAAAETLGILASWGFVVVAPDSCKSCADFGVDMLITADACRRDPALHPGLASADYSAIGVSGYSNGASATYNMSSDRARLAAHNITAIVVMHSGCGDPQYPPEVVPNCGSPVVPIMVTTGDLDNWGPPAFPNALRAYHTAQNVPSVYMSVAGAHHVPVDNDDNNAAGQFLSCHIKGRHCDEVYGPTGAAVCEQPFQLARCEVNQTQFGPAPAPPAPAPAPAPAPSASCAAALAKACGGDQGKEQACALCVAGNAAGLRSAGCQIELGTHDDAWAWCHAAARAD